MAYIYVVTVVLLIISYRVDKKKGLKSIKIGKKKIVKNLPVFLNIIVLVSFTLYFVSDDIIVRYLGEGNMAEGVFFGVVSGSVTLMPGFISFPLARVLLDKGVSYTVLAAFTNSLMLVGLMTFPLERRYFGLKATVLRNITGLFLALVVSLATGLIFGEFV